MKPISIWEWLGGHIDGQWENLARMPGSRTLFFVGQSGIFYKCSEPKTLQIHPHKHQDYIRTSEFKTKFSLIASNYGVFRICVVVAAECTWQTVLTLLRSTAAWCTLSSSVPRAQSGSSHVPTDHCDLWPSDGSLCLIRRRTSCLMANWPLSLQSKARAPPASVCSLFFAFWWPLTSRPCLFPVRGSHGD